MLVIPFVVRTANIAMNELTQRRRRKKKKTFRNVGDNVKISSKKLCE